MPKNNGGGLSLFLRGRYPSDVSVVVWEEGAEAEQEEGERGLIVCMCILLAIGNLLTEARLLAVVEVN